MLLLIPSPRKIVTVVVAVLIIITTTTQHQQQCWCCNAYPSGAGTCHGGDGRAAVRGSHLTRATNGTITDESPYQVVFINNNNDTIALLTATSTDGKQNSKSTTANNVVPVGSPIILSVQSDSTTTFRGVLIRVEAISVGTGNTTTNGTTTNNNTTTPFSLEPISNDSGSSSQVEITCFSEASNSVMGITHVDNSDKTQLNALLVVDIPAQLIVDVTIVQSNDNDRGSIYYYSQYQLITDPPPPIIIATTTPTTSNATTTTTSSTIIAHTNNHMILFATVGMAIVVYSVLV